MDKLIVMTELEFEAKLADVFDQRLQSLRIALEALKTDNLIGRNQAMIESNLKSAALAQYVKEGWIVNYGEQNSPLYLTSECRTARVRRKQQMSINRTVKH